MIAFKDLRTAEEVRRYQKQVLSRTGGRGSDNARLFHYTDIDALMGIVNSGHIWLSPSENMNDGLEAELIKRAGINDLYMTCFSRTNQNIAMFRMYADRPNGIMLSVTLSDAKAMLAQKPRVVEGEEITEEEVDTKLYWLGVCYKDLDSDRITTPSQINYHISAPLKTLAGSVKLSGWEYEKEVRLCARKRLYAGQKLAVKMPESMKVVLCPFFDIDKHKAQLAELAATGILCEHSEYEKWLKLD